MSTFTRMGAAAALGAALTLAGAGIAQAGPLPDFAFAQGAGAAGLSHPSTASITDATAATVSGTLANRHSTRVACSIVVSEASVVRDMENLLRSVARGQAQDPNAAAEIQNALLAASLAGHTANSETGVIEPGATGQWSVALPEPLSGPRTDFDAGAMISCDTADGGFFVEFAYERSGLLGSGSLGGGSTESLTGSLGS